MSAAVGPAREVRAQVLLEFGEGQIERLGDGHRWWFGRFAPGRSQRIGGAPVEGGFPGGSFRVSGPSGEAEFSLPVRGSKAGGTVYVEAIDRTLRNEDFPADRAVREAWFKAGR